MTQSIKYPKTRGILGAAVFLAGIFGANASEMPNFEQFDTLTAASANVSASESSAGLNFAFGGATTNGQNATALFAPELDAAASAVGLELVGLSQQLDFAETVLPNVDSNRDVFWLWAGTNNILIGAITGAPDPTLAPNELKAAMERLYKEVGARHFVVPNLMLLGNIPQFNKDPNTQAAINGLTAQQNMLLAQTIAEFRADYPRANVIELDVQSLFLGLEASGEFGNTNEACFTVGLPNGIPCSNFLYADDIHFTSSAAARIAELAAPELANMGVRRIITLGDSFVDTGSFYNTIERATGQGFPGFPFYEGRFSDGPNVIDHLEAMIVPDFASSAFPQPSRMNISEGGNDIAANVIVPAKVTLTNESFFGIVVLNFPNQGACFYYPDWNVDGKRRLTFCNGGLTAGETVSADGVELYAPFSRDEVTADVFFYQ